MNILCISQNFSKAPQDAVKVLKSGQSAVINYDTLRQKDIGLLLCERFDHPWCTHCGLVILMAGSKIFILFNVNIYFIQIMINVTIIYKGKVITYDTLNSNSAYYIDNSCNKIKIVNL